MFKCNCLSAYCLMVAMEINVPYTWLVLLSVVPSGLTADMGTSQQLWDKDVYHYHQCHSSKEQWWEWSDCAISQPDYLPHKRQRVV